MESGFPIGVGDKLRRNDGFWSLDSRSLIGVGVGDKLRGNDGLLSLDSRSPIGVVDKLRANHGLLSPIQYRFKPLL